MTRHFCLATVTVRWDRRHPLRKSGHPGQHWDRHCNTSLTVLLLFYFLKHLFVRLTLDNVRYSDSGDEDSSSKNEDWADIEFPRP